MEHGLKPGFYKISSVVDGSVLTVTSEGRRPHPVRSVNWESLETQKWKLRTRKQDGVMIQIIRNEAVVDNQVSKEVKGAEHEPTDWKFTPAPSSNGNVFQLNNSSGFLTYNGNGESVSFTDAQGPHPSQQWELEFLSEIPKQEN